MMRLPFDDRNTFGLDHRPPDTLCTGASTAVFTMADAYRPRHLRNPIANLTAETSALDGQRHHLLAYPLSHIAHLIRSSQQFVHRRLRLTLVGAIAAVPIKRNRIKVDRRLHALSTRRSSKRLRQGQHRPPMAFSLVGLNNGDPPKPGDLTLNVDPDHTDRNTVYIEKFWVVIRFGFIGVLIVIDTKLATCLPQLGSPDVVIGPPVLICPRRSKLVGHQCNATLWNCNRFRCSLKTRLPTGKLRQTVVDGDRLLSLAPHGASRLRALASAVRLRIDV